QIDDYLITVNEEETIPLGNEYFIITVPTRKAPVDALAVSIQTIMNTFYNIPSIPTGGGYVKKAIVFMEEFNVLRRIKRELYNEEQGAIFRKEKINDKIIVVGLQDLRNPRNQYFYNTTLEDYGDKTDIINDIARGRISKVVDTKSWLDGELWWGYMLDTIVNHYQGNLNNYASTRFNSVIEYSSKWRDDVGGAAVIASTSALEVGVDYSDVVLIYQHGAPPSISSLIQRAGRGGRRLFENPLMRIIVGIQLSPDLPHQSWLFEIFTRVKDLRKALDYDRLFLPKESEEIQRQVLVELTLEYYVLINGEATRENWECEFVDWLRKNKETVIDYSRWVFDKIEQKRLDLLIDEVIGDFNNICKKGAEVKV
ncbi:MAG: helicase-related protein, partial [Vulcanisaeta sp.]